MYYIKLKSIVLVGLLFLTFGLNAQNKNVVSAAIEYNNAEEALFMKQDVKTASEKILEAKELIDKAAVYDKTKDDPKCLMYVGKIYLLLPMIASLDSTNEKMAEHREEEAGEKYIEKSIAAFKESKKNDSRGRYSADVDEFLGKFRAILINSGVQSFQAEKFEQAYESFAAASRFAEILEIVDTVESFNAGLAAERIENFSEAAKYYKISADNGYRTPESYIFVSSAYRRAGEPDKALEYIKKVREKHPMNKDILIELVNINLEKGDNEAAQESLKEAIAADPENKQLHYVVGTVYDNLNQYKKAEEAYKNALELDSEYFDALYNLGALYFNKGVEIVQEANNELDDAKYKAMQEEAKLEFEKAVPMLEKAHKLEPEDRNTMLALKQLYPRLGMDDEYNAIKSKLEN